jgi:hypothetical protein
VIDNPDELLRLDKGKRSEKDGVKDAEHACRGADSQPGDPDGKQGKTEVFSERAERVSKILDERGHACFDGKAR